MKSRKIRLREIASFIWNVVIRLAILLFILWPVLWMLSSSFQLEQVLTDVPPHLLPWPKIFTLNHFKFLLTGEIPPGSSAMLQTQYTMSGAHILPAMGNSLIIAITTMFTCLLFGVPAAYTLSREDFKGKNTLLLSILATRLIPSISIAVPVYLGFKMVGLLDSKLGLILIHTSILLPFTIWILKPYFDSLPIELEESARIDGANSFQIVTRIVIPMAKAGLVATGVFTFMMSYGEFIFALILTSSLTAKTQSVVIATVSQGMSVSNGMLSAGTALCFTPPIVLALLFRKYIIKGLTARQI